MSIAKERRLPLKSAERTYLVQEAILMATGCIATLRAHFDIDSGRRSDGKGCRQ